MLGNCVSLQKPAPALSRPSSPDGPWCVCKITTRSKPRSNRILRCEECRPRYTSFQREQRGLRPCRSSEGNQEVSQGAEAAPAAANKPNLTAGAIAFWCFYAVYLWWLTASPYLPGPPIWRIGAAELKDVINESINFWYVNIGLEALGLPSVPAEAAHPVSEALFNFVNTWTFILLPLMVYDARGRKRIPLWIGAMFATNVFMVPYFALRVSPGALQAPARSSPPAPKSPVPGVKWPQFTRLFAWPAIIVTAISAVWLVSARPELGGSLSERWDYFVQAAKSDRAFAAFLSDMVLYSIWQVVLMRDAPTAYRWVPYFGILAWYLDFRRAALDGSPQQQQE